MLDDFLATLADAFRSQDLSANLTCREADAVVALYRANGWDSTAIQIAEAHAASDEPGDDHYIAPKEA